MRAIVTVACINADTPCRQHMPRLPLCLDGLVNLCLINRHDRTHSLANFVFVQSKSYLYCTAKVAPGLGQQLAAIIARLMLRPACLAPMHACITLVMKQPNHSLQAETIT